MNREARKNANRQKLIEATIDSIAELGLSDTTVGTVVKRAGLSQGIVRCSPRPSSFSAWSGRRPGANGWIGRARIRRPGSRPWC
jgi:hypothetical protein